MSPSQPTLFEDERAGKIYRTASRMIHERGFDATSMNDIAEAVGMTKAGVYYYVKGKQDLLFAIMSFAMDLLDREVVGPAERMADPEERLHLIVAEHARLLTHDTSALVILMDEVGSLSEDHSLRITHRKRSYFELLRRTLDELDAAGKLQPVDTTVAAFSILGMVMWLARWYRPEGRLASSEVVRDVARTALRSVLRGPVPAARAENSNVRRSRGNELEGLPADAAPAAESIVGREVPG